MKLIGCAPVGLTAPVGTPWPHATAVTTLGAKTPVQKAVSVGPGGEHATACPALRCKVPCACAHRLPHSSGDAIRKFLHYICERAETGKRCGIRGRQKCNEVAHRCGTPTLYARFHYTLFLTKVLIAAEGIVCECSLSGWPACIFKLTGVHWSYLCRLVMAQAMQGTDTRSY